MAPYNLGKEKQKKYSINAHDKDILMKKLTESVKENLAVIFAYIHGSFLLEAPFGDIDIAIYLDQSALPEKNQFIRCEISMEIELQEKFGYPFDVRIINRAPLSFRYNVLKNGKILFSRNEDLNTDFAARTFDDYIDFLPFRKRYLKEVLNLEI